MSHAALLLQEGGLSMVREPDSSGMGVITPEAESPIGAVRRKGGFTQAEFARIMGVTLMTLQEWEQTPQ
jgi:DNA-binding transcriptional regulator YiaG